VQFANKNRAFLYSLVNTEDDQILQRIEQVTREAMSAGGIKIFGTLMAEMINLPVKESRRLTEIACRPQICLKAEDSYDAAKVYGNSKTDEARRGIRLYTFRLLLLIKICTGCDDVALLTVNDWIEILDQVKKPRLKYDDSIPEHFHHAFRAIGTLLTYLTHVKDFLIYAKVGRVTSSQLTTSGEGYAKWVELAEEWFDTLHVKVTKGHRKALTVFISELESFGDRGHDPLVFLSQPSCKAVVANLKRNHPNRYIEFMRYIYKFTYWILIEYMTKQDDEDDEPVCLGYPLLSNHEYSLLVEKGSADDQPSQSVKVVLPTKYVYLLKEILTENDFEWPKSLTREYFDYLGADGKYTSVWVPTNTYLYLMMLELPLRKIQVAVLDSGEGDDEQYDLASQAWKKNRGVHANYWAALNAVRPQRGVITKIISHSTESVGLYINTNKTKDRDVRYGPESGYIIPWSNQLIIKYVSELRDWQELYNPVKGPTKYADIPNNVLSDSKPSQSVIDESPDRFYLFRSPLTSSGHFPFSPPTNNVLIKFWWSLMEELEKRLRLQGDDSEIVLKRNESTGQVEQTIFSPHGLRVTGLTSLSEAGVPIEILSKIIAGHSSILMTIYYIKYNAGHITEVLNNAKKSIEDNAKENMRLWLKTASFEEAKRFTATNDSDGLQEMLANRNLAALWQGSALGICPWGGTRCSDGGPLLKRGGKNRSNEHGPVEGGAKNCVRCRHLITGEPWLIELWLHCNSLLEQSTTISREVSDLRRKYETLLLKRREFAINSTTHLIPPSLIAEIKMFEALIDKKSQEVDDVLLNAHATHNLIEQIKLIQSKNVDSSTTENEISMISNSEVDDLDYIETTKFFAQDALTQASRIYPHIADARVEQERNQFMDQILYNNCIAPISLSPLTPEQKSSASDALARLLLSRVGARECENLHNNSVTLHQLGINEAVETTLVQLGLPISAPIPRPLRIVGDN
jgi:hypothetical protein